MFFREKGRVFFIIGLVLVGILLRFALHKPGSSVTQNVNVMTCNIGNISGSNRLVGEPLVRYIVSCGIPDILFLQEVWGQAEAISLAKSLGLPFHAFLGGTQSKSIGIAVLSRLPMSNIRTLTYNNSKKGAGAIRAEVIADRVTVTLVNTHMDRLKTVSVKDGFAAVDWKTVMPVVEDELWGDTVRSRMVVELITWLDTDKPEHLILGGDFNTIPLSKAIRLLTKTVDDVLWPSLDYFKGTYTKLDFPVAPRIDYLFVSPDLVPDSREIISQSPGDHLPIRATIRIPVRG